MKKYNRNLSYPKIALTEDLNGPISVIFLYDSYENVMFEYETDLCKKLIEF